MLPVEIKLIIAALLIMWLLRAISQLRQAREDCDVFKDKKKATPYKPKNMGKDE